MAFDQHGLCKKKIQGKKLELESPFGLKRVDGANFVHRRFSSDGRSMFMGKNNSMQDAILHLVVNAYSDLMTALTALEYEPTTLVVTMCEQF